MIKVDIINEVSKAADITKVKAEVAAEAGDRPQPADGQGGQDPARTHHPLQARQGPPEPESVASFAAPQGGGSLQAHPRTPWQHRTLTSRSRKPIRRPGRGPLRPSRHSGASTAGMPCSSS